MPVLASGRRPLVTRIAPPRSAKAIPERGDCYRELPRNRDRRSSQNSYSRHFGEYGKASFLNSAGCGRGAASPSYPRRREWQRSSARLGPGRAEHLRRPTLRFYRPPSGGRLERDQGPRAFRRSGALGERRSIGRDRSGDGKLVGLLSREDAERLATKTSNFWQEGTYHREQGARWGVPRRNAEERRVGGEQGHRQAGLRDRLDG